MHWDVMHVQRDVMHVHWDVMHVQRDALCVQGDVVHVQRDTLRVQRDTLRVQWDMVWLCPGSAALQAVGPHSPPGYGRPPTRCVGRLWGLRAEPWGVCRTSPCTPHPCGGSPGGGGDPKQRWWVAMPWHRGCVSALRAAGPGATSQRQAWQCHQWGTHCVGVPGVLWRSHPGSYPLYVPARWETRGQSKLGRAWASERRLHAWQRGDGTPKPWLRGDGTSEPPPRARGVAWTPYK